MTYWICLFRSYIGLCRIRSGKDCFPHCENGMSILVTSLYVYLIGSVGHSTFSLTGQRSPLEICQFTLWIKVCGWSTYWSQWPALASHLSTLAGRLPSEVRWRFLYTKEGYFLSKRREKENQKEKRGKRKGNGERESDCNLKKKKNCWWDFFCRKF